MHSNIVAAASKAAGMPKQHVRNGYLHWLLIAVLLLSFAFTVRAFVLKDRADAVTQGILQAAPTQKIETLAAQVNALEPKVDKALAAPSTGTAVAIQNVRAEYTSDIKILSQNLIGMSARREAQISKLQDEVTQCNLLINKLLKEKKR